MTHVLHVVPGLEIGGAETMLLQLVRALGSPVFEHTVINMQSHGPLTATLEAAGARVVHLGMQRGRPNATGLARLVRVAQQRPFDVAQGWMYHGNLGAQLVASVVLHRPTVVWSVHTHQPPPITEIASWLVARANATLSRRPDAVVYVARAAMAAHARHGFGVDNAVYVPGGIDTQAFTPNAQARVNLRGSLGIAPDTPVVALVARLHPMKDHANFLAAAARAAPTLHFVLAGEGLRTLPGSLARWVTPELAARLHWLGARHDIAAVLQGSDICTLSSISEALPRILLEAMACETPCVATDVGDCAALLRDVGWLVPTRDPAALAHAWQQALSCPSDVLTTRLRRGRSRIEAEHSLDQMGRTFASLWRACYNSEL